MSCSSTNATESLRHIPLFYNSADSQPSALRLILTLLPDWEHSEGKIEFLLKVIKKRPGYTDKQIDEESVLLRAYGKGTEVLIDRERETTSHSLLAQHNLAPPLLARFQNGLLYRFIRGYVCTSTDLTREAVWRGVARRLGQWHSVLPIISKDHNVVVEAKPNGIPSTLSRSGSAQMDPATLQAIRDIAPGIAAPNLWTVMQKWICALPTGTKTEKTRKNRLQTELKRLVEELGNTPGLGKDGLIFGHCDLLSGNVIIHPPEDGASPENGAETVSFIDYEYATPTPAAFDIANHFAEWGGFECDYNVLPTRSQRRGFLQDYLKSYSSHLDSSDVETEEVQRIFDEVDLFRGVPGFYWGIWALIQATISQIDFDYASYAEVRLGEYWAWREESEGTRVAEGKEMPLRERRWAQEA
ncbi:MAG: hypothetical protein M1827_006593 [Pycnora praestabilis]|nr:MAG: hypothetical protein M1827_006593 [Pycnora praestabilis]